MASTPIKGRVPPHNLDAERAVLGAILLNEKALPEVMDYLVAGDFYKTGHQLLFEAIVDFRNENSDQTIDLITISEYLKSRNKLPEVGGMAALAALTSEVPTTTNAIYYAKIVQGLSRRRTVLILSGALQEKAFDESLSVSEMLDESEQVLSDLNTLGSLGQTYFEPRKLLTDTMSRIEERHRTHSNEGLITGYHRLDDMMGGFKNSEFIVIGARPSVGKTAFALSIAHNMALKGKVKVGFFSLEMSAVAIMERLLAAESKVSFGHIRNARTTDAEINMIVDACGRFYEAELYIQDTPNIKLNDLRMQARRMKREKGVEIIFIDYIGLINPESSAQTPRHEQIAHVSRSMKALARQLDIPIVCLSQVGRQSEGKEPSLADLRESGSIEQDADVVILMHRNRIAKEEEQSEERKYGEKPEKRLIVTKDNQGRTVQQTTIIVAKQRNGEVGDFDLGFLPDFVRFENFDFSV